MKIALCIAGLAAKGRLGHDAHQVGYKHLKESFFSKYPDVDVFLHSNEPELQDELIDYYKPLDYIFEPQSDFHEQWQELNPKFQQPHWMGPQYYKSLFGMMYGRYAVGQLKTYYEQKNGFLYDWVILARYDAGAYTNEPLYFDENLDNQFIYLPMYEYMTNGPQDQWFFSNSKDLDLLLSLYLRLPEYLANDSEYVKTALSNWIDAYHDVSKGFAGFENEIFKSAENKGKKPMKLNMDQLTCAHPIYKWLLYTHGLWTLDKLKFVAPTYKTFKEEPHPSIIRILS